MSEEVVEAVKYLYGCIMVETESNLLYTIATQRLPCPELSTITIALAQDNQKHAKMIKELCRPLNEMCFNPSDLAKDFKKISIEIDKLKDDITPLVTIEKEEIGDFLKSLTNLEDCLHNLYANFLQSTLFSNFAEALYEASNITEDNLSYIIEAIKKDNLQHRNMLIESLYHYHKATQKNIEPSIKYQNPDSWIRY
jgi:hypothetical protein